MRVAIRILIEMTAVFSDLCILIYLLALDSYMVELPRLEGGNCHGRSL